MIRSIATLRTVLLTLGSSGLLALSVHAGTLYRVTDIGTLGGNYSDAQSINEQGQVTGTARTSGGDYHGYIFHEGVLTDIDVPTAELAYTHSINNRGQVAGDGRFVGSSEAQAFLYSSGAVTNLGALLGALASQAHDVNDAGLVVGSYRRSSGRSHPFLYDGHTAMDLGTMGYEFGEAFGVNASGQVAGRVEDGPGPMHAFLFSAGSMVDIGTLGGTEAQAFAINDLGHVVGNSALASGTAAHSFLYDGTRMIDLGTLGGNHSEALGINRFDEIVGNSRTSSGLVHAFLYRNGSMYDLNDLIDPASGWNLEWAHDINDAGQIVGFGTVHGEQHGYLLTPLVPEPPTFVLLACLAALAGLRRGWRSLTRQGARS